VPSSGLGSSVQGQGLRRCVQPWHDFDAYLDVGLTDIRNEFGIEIVTVN
jgi:hypothetical protein